MKILVIHQLLPIAPLDGGRLRRLQHVQALAAQHAVTLVGRCPDAEAGEAFLRNHPAWRTLLVPESENPSRSLVTETVHQLTSAEPFDCVHVAGLSQWPGTRSLARSRVVLDIENVETTVLEQIRQVGAAPVSAFDVAATDAFLGSTCRRADLVVACSVPERNALQRLAPTARIAIVPNAVDVSSFADVDPRRAGVPPVIAFTGLLAYWPNADACAYFVENVLPHIERSFGPVRFQMVGHVPPATLVSLADGERVSLAADVPDIRPWLAAADVLVVPLRTGSSTHVKILEGFAAGRPIVSTAIGCEGLEVEPGRHLLVADDAESFAAAVERVLTDRACADALVREAAALVRDRYDVPVVQQVLRALYGTLPPPG